MSIGDRIRAFQIVAAAAAAAMAATALLELRASDAFAVRVQWARQQLAATSQLAIQANRYSEQIAELLLIGEPERVDFESARTQMIQAFADLGQITIQEAASLQDPKERAEENVELERLDSMRALFSEIDRAVERLLFFDREGRREQAIALFRSDIENRLDAEFERLIGAALADERGEVRAIEEAAADFARWSTVATLGVLGSLLALTLISGVLFFRSIKRPVAALTEGALALGRGNFDHRIAYSGGGEFGVLSERFDAMAEELGRQRALLVDSRGELERQVAERTSELADANKKLADANQRLTATDQQRIRFLADISHELRTPLTALRGEAEVALRGASKPEAAYRETLATVVARSADLARLVDDLLFLARSEVDAIWFDFRRIALDGVVADAVADARTLARETAVRIEVRSEAAGLTVRGDPRRLKQALLIPLDNALKYADPGTKVVVVVRAARPSIEGSGRADAEVLIRDQGPGVSPDDAPRAFERFHRGAAARERWAGGSGLGLPIARWIIEKHGGAIDLSSVLGQGTEIRIRLPALG